jgi:hypothetical protein
VRGVLPFLQYTRKHGQARERRVCVLTTGTRVPVLEQMPVAGAYSREHCPIAGAYSREHCPIILGSNFGGGGPVRGLRGGGRRGGVRSGPGAASTILLFHTISARPSKQPRKVVSTLGVYSFGLIFVSASTDKRHHHHPPLFLPPFFLPPISHPPLPPPLPPVEFQGPPLPDLPRIMALEASC